MIQAPPLVTEAAQTNTFTLARLQYFNIRQLLHTCKCYFKYQAKTAMQSKPINEADCPAVGPKDVDIFIFCFSFNKVYYYCCS
jgi:hypothetical protein